MDLRDLDSIKDPEVLIKRLKVIKDVEVLQKIGKGNFGKKMRDFKFDIAKGEVFYGKWGKSIKIAAKKLLATDPYTVLQFYKEAYILQYENDAS